MPQNCGILSLPNELIEQIYINLTPADIPNFARSCRTILRTIEVRLPTHRLLRNRHKYFNSRDIGTEPRSNIFDETPYHGIHCSYIHTLELSEYLEPDDIEQYEPALRNRWKSLTSSLPTNVHFKRRSMNASQWLNSWGTCAFGALVCLAPNIRSLVFDHEFQDADKADYVVGLLARSLYRPFRLEWPFPFFLDLRDISIHMWDRGLLSCLAFIAIFARLPSLVEVKASHFNDQVVPAIDVSWRHLRTASSNIQILTFRFMKFNLEEFHQCLRAIRSLKQLTIIDDKWMDGNGIMASAVLTALHRYHRSSLEKLALIPWKSRTEMPPQQFQSCLLRSFTRLKCVYMLHRFFRCNCPEFHSSSLLDEESNSNDEDKSRFDLYNSAERLNVQDVLPPSIEIIGIDRPEWYTPEIIEFTNKVLDAKIKDGSLPVLRTIDMKNPNEGKIYKEAQQLKVQGIGSMLEQHGIAMRFGPWNLHVEHHPWGRLQVSAP